MFSVLLILLFDSVVSLYEYSTSTGNLQWGSGLLLMVEIMRNKHFGYILFVLFLFIAVILAMSVFRLYDKVFPKPPTWWYQMSGSALAPRLCRRQKGQTISLQ
jgi:hypothetical protein